MKQRIKINLDIPDAPCMGCSERYAGCHTECERYKDFRKICEEASKERITENGIENFKIEAIYKAQKRANSKTILGRKK